MSATTNTIPELNDELICIADFKLVLGGWYMMVLSNGRSIGDWCALCGMLQDQYGHARAIYRYLATAGVPGSRIDPARDASEIRGPAILDTAPSSWDDFIATAFLAELMVDQQLQAFALAVDPPEPQLALLAKKMLRESRFHQSYVTGWMRNLLSTDAGAPAAKALTSRFGQALDWWPSIAQPDVVHHAGFRSADIDVREVFVAAVERVAGDHDVKLGATAPPDRTPERTWDRVTRRGDGQTGIPQRLHEAIRFKNVELATT
jgi:ring-1,2-phenylacetyl-CoA epoxidase subunit PaaC